MKTFKVGSLYKITGKAIVDSWYLTKNERNNMNIRPILGERIGRGDYFILLEYGEVLDKDYDYKIKILTKDGFIGWTFAIKETTIRVTD